MGWRPDCPRPPRPRPDQPTPEPLTDPEGPEGEGSEDEPKAKIRIKLADGKTRAIRYLATTTCWSADSKSISAQEFMERLFGDLTGLITDEDHLCKVWSNPDSRETFLKQLSDRGYDTDRLNAIRRLVDAPDSDLFDVLGYVLVTTDPKTRHDPADAVRGNDLAEAQHELKSPLISILDAYERNGAGELATKKLGQFLTARYGSVGEAKNRRGGLPQIKAAFQKMRERLYSSRVFELSLKRV